MTSQHKTYRLIDLFCGAGGLSLGFSDRVDASFRPVWANDIDRFAAATYNLNFGNHCTTADIVSLLDGASFTVPPADVVIGGPPCQGFSLLNKNRNGDARKQLWRQFLDVVERSGAGIFVMENVPQLLASDEFFEISGRAREMGFQLASATLLATDYGVPQRRYRAVIIGCRFADPGCVFPPKRTHVENAEMASRQQFKIVSDHSDHPQPWRTVRDAIADLDPPVGTEIRNCPAPYNLHFGRTPTAKSLMRYAAIPSEGMNRFDLQRLAPEITPGCWIRKTSGGTDLFGRLWWDRPAFTIRTEFFKPEKGRYLHPTQHRPITHREAARLQSFPDWFQFVGSKVEVAKQIGNAVPPALAAQIAGCVVSLLALRGDRLNAGSVHGGMYERAG